MATILEQASASLQTATTAVRTFVRSDLPKWIDLLNAGLTDEDQIDTVVEEAVAAVRKAKDTDKLSYSYLDKQLVLASIFLFACGYRTVEFAGRMLNKANTGKILSRAKQFMSVYSLISELYIAGLHHSLKSSRSFFRSLFERIGGVSASDAKRLVFENIVGQGVSDETYTYYVTGSRIENGPDAGKWDVKPMLVKYQDALRKDKELTPGSTPNADRFRESMTVAKVLEFEASIVREVSTETDEAAEELTA